MNFIDVSDLEVQRETLGQSCSLTISAVYKVEVSYSKIISNIQGK